MIECKKFIFDVDATLVDTQAVIDNIWKKWCETVGVSYVDMSQYIHGRKIEETLHCISPSYACDVQVEKVKSIALSEMTKAQAISNAHSFPTLVLMLGVLRQAGQRKWRPPVY